MIRSATTGDARSIAEIQVASWRAAYRGILPEAYLMKLDVEHREKVWAGVCGKEGGVLLVAVGEPGVVGFCHVTSSRDADGGGRGEITSLYLAPDQMRRGWGRALVQAALEFASESGFPQVTLWVLVENLAARQFYEALGFRPDGNMKEENDADVCLREMRYFHLLSA